MAILRALILLGIVGFVAQLVDGSLGMAYGVTSTTLLLAVGTNPAAASATVHLAEIGTTLASGISHWRFDNIDWKVVAKIGIPGAAGAFAGATFLSSLSTEVAVGSEAGLVAASVANFDNTLLLDRARLIRRLGRASPATMEAACRALATAIGCR